MKKDLFEAEGEELFCPLDGGKLTDSKWEWCDWRLQICPNGHVWEARWSPQWKHQLQFDVIDMVRCECGQLCPDRLMEHANFDPLPEPGWFTPPPSQRAKHPKRREWKVCPDCFEKIRQAWKPDLEQSHARLVITPIRRGDKVVFQYDESIEIRPYPNPYGCGGCYGGGVLETEAEVEEFTKSFTASRVQDGSPFVDDYYSRWQKLGVKFEVIRKPEMTMAEHINEREYEKIQENPKDAGPAQLHLIA